MLTDKATSVAPDGFFTPLEVYYCCANLVSLVAFLNNTSPKIPSKIMAQKATGAFDVKLAPLASDFPADDPNLGRMSIDKTFSGRP